MGGNLGLFGSIEGEILNGLLEGCQVIDSDMRYAYVNDAVVKHARVAREQLLGRGMSECFPGIEHTPIYALIERCMGDGQRTQLENEFTYPDGSIGWFELRVFPVSAGVCLLSLDITQRKLAERAQQHLAAIVEGTQNAIWSKSLDGIVSSWNGAAERLTGYAAVEMIGNSIAPIIPAHLQEEQKQSLMRVANGERVPPFETLRRHRDGTLIEVLLTVSPLVDANGKVFGASTIVQDVTEKKRNERERERLTEQLFRSNQRLEQYARIAAHDLREPLRTVVSFSELIQQTGNIQSGGETSAYLDLIIAAGQRMQRLVSDLLAHTKIEPERKVFQLVSLESVIQRVERALSALLTEAEATLTYGQSSPSGDAMPPPSELPLVRGDESQLEQLFQNLIQNAVKFRADKRPHIVISGVRRDADVCVSVADNGIGIAEKDKWRVFEMGQRAHTDIREGTGMGLSIAKSIVERHDGEIWLESVEGRGTTFFFTLPLAIGE